MLKQIRKVVVVLGLIGVFSSIITGQISSLYAQDADKKNNKAPTPTPGAVDYATKENNRVLRVQNQTPFIVILYVSGVRMGWINPQRSGLIRGLMTGNHKLYAHSQYGTVAWGPRDVWVPGTWNLGFKQSDSGSKSPGSKAPSGQASNNRFDSAVIKK